MRINRNNYEIRFIDYADGKLSAEDKKELFQFLNTHPDLKEEFESFENVKLDADKTVFENKEALKKSSLVINQKNCEEYFIAYHENLLSAADKKAVEQFVNNYPGVKKDFESFGKMYLDAGIIVFEEKEILKTAHTIISNENSDWWMISAVENTLTEKEKTVFEKELSANPAFRTEFEKYRNTILDSTCVTFNEKNSLRRKDGKIIPIYLRYVSYAAAACFLVFLGWKWSSPEITEDSATKALTALHFDFTVSPDKEKNNEENFIAEEKITNENIPQKENNISPVHQVEIVKENQFASNSIPIDKIRKKNNPEILVQHPEHELVRTNSIPVDSTKVNIANAVNEKNNPPVTGLAFGNQDEKYLSPKEFVVQQFNKKVLNKNTSDNPSSEELASVASVKISDATQTPVNITANKESEYKTYGFSIGKFGFSKTKKIR